MIKRTREDFIGDERRDPQNRWSRVLEARIGEIEADMLEIRGQLADGRTTMGALKIGQSILMSDLGKTKDDVARIQENTGSLANTYRDFIGARRIIAWVIAMILAVAATIQTTVTVVERFNQQKLSATVKP